jgi:hypothetical protein
MKKSDMTQMWSRYSACVFEAYSGFTDEWKLAIEKTGTVIVAI